MTDRLHRVPFLLSAWTVPFRLPRSTPRPLSGSMKAKSAESAMDADRTNSTRCGQASVCAIRILTALCWRACETPCVIQTPPDALGSDVLFQRKGSRQASNAVSGWPGSKGDRRGSQFPNKSGERPESARSDKNRRPLTASSSGTAVSIDAKSSSIVCGVVLCLTQKANGENTPVAGSKTLMAPPDWRTAFTSGSLIVWVRGLTTRLKILPLLRAALL